MNKIAFCLGLWSKLQDEGQQLQLVDAEMHVHHKHVYRQAVCNNTNNCICGSYWLVYYVKMVSVRTFTSTIDEEKTMRQRVTWH